MWAVPPWHISDLMYLHRRGWFEVAPSTPFCTPANNSSRLQNPGGNVNVGTSWHPCCAQREDDLLTSKKQTLSYTLSLAQRKHKALWLHLLALTLKWQTDTADIAQHHNHRAHRSCSFSRDEEQMHGPGCPVTLRLITLTSECVVPSLKILCCAIFLGRQKTRETQDDQVVWLPGRGHGWGREECYKPPWTRAAGHGDTSK